jgi:uncharacterized DUF497 family protein
LGYQIHIQRKQRGLESHASSRHRGFAAGVTRANHHHIVLFSERRHRFISILQVKEAS